MIVFCVICGTTDESSIERIRKRYFAAVVFALVSYSYISSLYGQKLDVLGPILSVSVINSHENL